MRNASENFLPNDDAVSCHDVRVTSHASCSKTNEAHVGWQALLPDQKTVLAGFHWGGTLGHIYVEVLEHIFWQEANSDVTFDRKHLYYTIKASVVAEPKVLEQHMQQSSLWSAVSFFLSLATFYYWNNSAYHFFRKREVDRMVRILDLIDQTPRLYPLGHQRQTKCIWGKRMFHI